MPRSRTKPVLLVTPTTNTPEVVLSLNMGRYLHALEANNRSATDKKRKCYEELRGYVSGLAGATVWEKVKNKLLEHPLINDSVKEHALANTTNPSLVTAAMSESCVELLKNGMDAFIDTFVARGRRGPTVLKITFGLDLDKDGTLALTITDNAGGFSPAALTKFNALASSSELYLQDKKDKSPKIDSNCYFGGKGLGLLQLIAFVCYKSNHLNPRSLNNVYSDSSPSGIVFTNPQPGMGSMRLTGPLLPLQKKGLDTPGMVHELFELKLGTPRFFSRRAETMRAQSTVNKEEASKTTKWRPGSLLLTPAAGAPSISIVCQTATTTEKDSDSPKFSFSD